MKQIFSLLLFCLILESILSTKRTLKMKLAKAIKNMKTIANSKNTRKLDGTDGDSESGADTDKATTPPTDEYKDESTESEPEAATATAANSAVMLLSQFQ